MKFLIALALLFLQSDTFTKLTYCHDLSRGPYELQCVELNPAGSGTVWFKRRGMDEVKVTVTLSAAARERFVAAVAATSYLADDESWESSMKVADLGMKNLTIDTASGPRKKSYNYSKRPEVIALAGFFDGVINAETISFEVDTMLQFDKLGIPKKVEQIGNELKSSRIADPERMIPILEKIQKDQRLVNYARANAGKMKDDILAKKKP